ncbi:MAG: uroporphyrinogen-III synthase [Candidatus Dormibacteria bacterium]
MNENPAPLHGRRIVVTQAESQAESLLERLRALGAEAASIPLIAIHPVADATVILEAMERLRHHSGPTYAVFASANAVRLTGDAVGGTGVLTAYLAGVAVGAMGPETAAALTMRGVVPAITPAEFRAEAMAAALVERGVRGARIWLPSAAGSRPVLATRLREAGGLVDRLTLYRSLLPEAAAAQLAGELCQGPVDAVAFTSGSTVHHFRQALSGRPFPEGAVAACIGPVTAGVARRAGFPVGVVSSQATTASLADALVAHYG